MADRNRDQRHDDEHGDDEIIKALIGIEAETRNRDAGDTAQAVVAAGHVDPVLRNDLIVTLKPTVASAR